MIPSFTLSLASNGTPIMVALELFGVVAERLSLRMSLAMTSPAPPIAVRTMKFRREMFAGS